MGIKSKTFFKRAAFGLCIALFLVVAFTVYANVRVENAAKDRIYTDVDAIQHNRVALLLGTNPINRLGRPNSYFTNRINTAARLFHAGKVDFIIASGDNHTKRYDETTAMRDSLVAHGIPEDRIVMDFAGFRTLDSVVRAKEVFGCDSITIISQADHNARALYLAEANGIDAVAISAPLRAGRWTRARLAIREWLARDKMMLDILFGKRPHFLGEKIEIPRAVDEKDALAGRWKVTTYADMASSKVSAIVSADGDYILRLHDRGFFSFTTDCNTISGDYVVNGRELRFVNISATELGCEKEVVERCIKSCLGLVESCDFPTDTTLWLLGSRDNVLIELVKLQDGER